MWRVSSASTTSASRSSASTRKRDVVEVADRGRADGERHADAPTRARRGRRAPRRSSPRPGRAAPRRSAPRRAERQRLAPDDLARRLDQQVERGVPEAAADDDDLRPEDVHERADRDAQVLADLVERRMLLARRGRGRRRQGRARAGRAGRPPSPSSTTRRGRDRCRRPGTARRPRRSRGGRARPSRGRGGRRSRRRRRRPCRASAATSSLTPWPAPDAVLGQRGRARVVVDGDRQARAIRASRRGSRGRGAGC